MSSPNSRPNRTGPGNRYGGQEDRAWRQLYDSIDDVEVAVEVIRHLDSDEEGKRLRLALYLRAKQTVRRDAERLVRYQRIGAFVRWILSSLVHTLGGARRSTRRMARNGGELAVELLPQQAEDDAVPRARKLVKRKVPTPAPAPVTVPVPVVSTVVPGSAGNVEVQAAPAVGPKSVA